MLTERDHWGFWSLPDLTNCYHPSDLALPLPTETFTRAPPRDTQEQLYTPIMTVVERVERVSRMAHSGGGRLSRDRELNTRSERVDTRARRQAHSERVDTVARWPASGMAFRLIKQNDKMVI